MYTIHNNFLGIDIDHMYIDTTFCSKNSHHLPSRQDSVNIVIKEIRNWLELSESFTLLYFDLNSVIWSSITVLI